MAIGSEAENDWLVETFGHETLWIGFYQPEGSEEPSGGWQWISGETVTYTNWRGGQPNEGRPGADYTIINNNWDGGSNPWGFWDDVPVEGWPGPLRWIVEISPLPGDANGDGIVSDADYTVWADHYGAWPATCSMGDFDGSGEITDADYTIWADHYGHTAGRIPEPTCVGLLGLAILAPLRRVGSIR